MIIDRHTFIDLATHLEGASEGVLDITRRCVALCEEGGDGRLEGPTWMGLVESLITVNAELTALEQTLRALLEANREEEEDSAKRSLRRARAAAA
ncbi:MAG TPA: hypothetical protein VIS07_05980 [Candidatus Binatia bacterium]